MGVQNLSIRGFANTALARMAQLNLPRNLVVPGGARQRLQYHQILKAQFGYSSHARGLSAGTTGVTDDSSQHSAICSGISARSLGRQPSRIVPSVERNSLERRQGTVMFRRASAPNKTVAEALQTASDRKSPGGVSMMNIHACLEHGVGFFTGVGTLKRVHWRPN